MTKWRVHSHGLRHFYEDYGDEQRAHAAAQSLKDGGFTLSTYIEVIDEKTEGAVS
jgi:hypothetical protein